MHVSITFLHHCDAGLTGGTGATGETGTTGETGKLYDIDGCASMTKLHGWSILQLQAQLTSLYVLTPSTMSPGVLTRHGSDAMMG